MATPPHHETQNDFGCVPTLLQVSWGTRGGLSERVGVCDGPQGARE